VRGVGWKVFYKVSQEDFKRMYEQAQGWGDLTPYRVVVDGAEYYGAGLVSSLDVGQEAWGYSPKISHPVGVNTRITVKLIAYADALEPIGSYSHLYIVFYVNAETAKDPEGYEAFGFRIALDNPYDYAIAGLLEFRVEQSNNKITLYVNNAKVGEAQLTGPLASFRLLVHNARYQVASGSASLDAHGIIIYEVVAEYYDMWEDLFNMITQIMFITMFITLGVTLFTSVFKAVRGVAGE
jgi:hypothetical protein